MKNKITCILSLQLGKVFQQHLSKEVTDENKLWAEVLLTLNKIFFRKHLLFRNYLLADEQPWQTLMIKGGRIKIHVEANFYLLEVLSRRLTLANNLKNKPTNMHALLIAYCQRSKDDIWHHSRIERGFFQQNISDNIFQDFATKLNQQRQRLGENYSEISQRRRREFGAYWFINNETCIEISEELSLFEVLALTPLLQEEQAPPPLLLVKVIESLNEKYGLLRSCGLPPRFWFARDIPIGQLKELKQLCIQVKLLTEKGESKMSAYEHAFNQLKNKAKTWGGFNSFNEFLYSLLGQTITGIFLDSMESEVENEPPDLEQQLSNLPSQYPEDFNSVIKYAFISLIVEQAKVYSQGKEGLVNDPQFLLLVKENPEYATLSKKELIKTLQHQLASIIKKHIGQ